MTADVSRRKIQTLRWFYASLLTEDLNWVACRACGALYPDASDLADCHICPLQGVHTS